MFAWRKRNETISAGAQFRRTMPSKASEIAQVVAVSSDRTGIPHVRFRLRVERPDRPAVQSAERTLSLAAFKQLFPERLAH
ncbi:MAG TPA: hypothetical protein VFO41_17710 [Alphaproteobacteria bacterium]|nr:hypothetical protein [Alphaproteobacteria bacterium]